MRLSHVMLYVPDVAKAVAFYGRAFGLAARFVHETGTYAELATGETVIAFVQENLAEDVLGAPFTPMRTESPLPSSALTFTVEDVRRAFDTAVAAGCEAHALPQAKPWGQVVAYLRDEHGFLIEIASEIGA